MSNSPFLPLVAAALLITLLVARRRRDRDRDREGRRRIRRSAYPLLLMHQRPERGGRREAARAVEAVEHRRLEELLAALSGLGLPEAEARALYASTRADAGDPITAFRDAMLSRILSHASAASDRETQARAHTFRARVLAESGADPADALRVSHACRLEAFRAAGVALLCVDAEECCPACQKVASDPAPPERFMAAPALPRPGCERVLCLCTYAPADGAR